MASLEEELIMDGQVERLHAALVDALRQSRAAPFDSPVTVAEIYQDLVPYRAVRSMIGFEMNADYEHTLLRLLAGEGDLALLDPPEARDELRRELESPNPNVALFRKFAGCYVSASTGTASGDAAAASPALPASPSLAQAEADEDGDDDAAAARRSAFRWSQEVEVMADDDGAPQPRDNAGTAVEPVAQPADDAEEPEFELVPVQRPRASVPAAAAATAGRCAFCDSDLPARRTLRFCPFCGSDQSHRPCATCGEALESGWRFCVACGTVAEERD
jgi:hypothetical protein